MSGTMSTDLAGSPFFEQLERRILLDGVSEQQAVELFELSPALFVENQGQWEDQSVRYAFQGSGATVLHTDTGPVFHLFQSEEDEADDPHVDLPGLDEPFDDEPPEVRSTSFSVHFDGAEPVIPVGLEESETVFNYFVGEQANWRSNVPGYEVVAYEGLYDGVDLHTWGRRNSLKYEFHVAPGADYAQIQISYDGIDGLYIDAAGALHVQTELGELVDDAPYIYQMIDGEEVEVEGAFVLVDADTYSFVLTGEYDAASKLIIDPDLAWSSYLGGSATDHGRGIAVDASGNALVTGGTYSSGWVSGGWDPSYNGGKDAFVAKLSPTGGHIWSTYLGGSDSDSGRGIAVDASGNVLVTGKTRSSGWVSGGWDTSLDGVVDAFVVKLSPTGGHVWSSYLGGSSGDSGRGIAVDASGNALVTGSTSSSGWVSGGWDTSHNGTSDAFVVKLSPTGGHIWSSYLGGSVEDYGYGIAVDASGNALVTGGTQSSGWVSGGWDTSYNGGWDAFVAKLSPTGGHIWSSYLGGSGYEGDHGYGIAVDASGNVLVTGRTFSSGWVSGGWDTSHNGSGDAFVAKLSPTGGHIWSSYLGGSNAEEGWGIAVDASGNALVTGYTTSSGWVSGGWDTSYNGGSDAFVAKIVVRTEVVVDNASAAVTGNWLAGTYRPSYYGVDYLHDKNSGKGSKRVTFTPTLMQDGQYEVYIWWPEAPIWATNVPVDVMHDGGTSTVSVDESTNGGQWNLVGTYNFTAGTGSVTIRAKGTTSYVVADAVRFLRIGDISVGDVIVDNASATVTGNWMTSTYRPGYHDADYLHDKNSHKGGKSITFTPTLMQDGQYEVYMWWPEAPIWATNVPVDVMHDGGTSTVSVDESTNGGQWNLIGTYDFTAGTGGVTIRAKGTTSYVVADAVRFLRIGDISAIEVIVDNTSATVTGDWMTSSYRPDYHGLDYLHDKNTDKGTNSVTFTPTLPQDGQYEVYVWWPDAPIWDSAVPVDIAHDGGTSTVLVDESTNGGQWNLIGTYDFTAGTGSVTIRTDGTTLHVAVDAVRFLRVGDI